MNATGQVRQPSQGGAGANAATLGLGGEVGGPGPRSAERAVADAADRLLRAPHDKVVLVLHLSLLAPSALKAHHLRVARMLMQDCARRFDGQVFALQNHDLVLLSGLPRARPAGSTAAASAETPSDLRQCLVGLFAEATAEPQKLVSYWRLAEDAAPFRGFIGGVVASGASGSREMKLGADDMPASPASLAALEEIAANAPLAELLQQQTGMLLNPDRKLPLALRLKPGFRQLSLSLSALNLPRSVAESLTDPFLLHHFATRLQLRLVQVLHDDLRVAGRLTRVALKTGLPIMVELSPEATLGPGFARLTRLSQDTGTRFIIEMPLMQACLDIELLEQVRGRLASAGFGLCVGLLDSAALRLVPPMKLLAGHGADSLVADACRRGFRPEGPGGTEPGAARGGAAGAGWGGVGAGGELGPGLRDQPIPGAVSRPGAGGDTHGGLPGRFGLHPAAMHDTRQPPGRSRTRRLHQSGFARCWHHIAHPGEMTLGKMT